MDIVLFGIQGSGKGTQASFVCEKYDITYYGTGKALRDYIAQEDNPKAQELKQMLASGKLVSDELMIDMLEEFLVKNKEKPIIFDGIPRNMNQFMLFDSLMKKLGRDYQSYFFDISLSEAMKRIKSRGEIEGRDDDQEIAIVLERFRSFFEQTFPVITRLLKDRSIEIIEAFMPPKEVFAKFDVLLEQYNYERGIE